MYTHEWSDVQHCPIGLDDGQLRSGGPRDRPHPHDKWQKSPSRAGRRALPARRGPPHPSPPCAAGGGSNGRVADGRPPSHGACPARDGGRRPAGRGGPAPAAVAHPGAVRNIPYAPPMSPVARLAGSVASPALTTARGGPTRRRSRVHGHPSDCDSVPRHDAPAGPAITAGGAVPRADHAQPAPARPHRVVRRCLPGAGRYRRNHEPRAGAPARERPGPDPRKRTATKRHRPPGVRQARRPASWEPCRR